MHRVLMKLLAFLFPEEASPFEVYGNWRFQIRKEEGPRISFLPRLVLRIANYKNCSKEGQPLASLPNVLKANSDQSNMAMFFFERLYPLINYAGKLAALINKDNNPDNESLKDSSLVDITESWKVDRSIYVL